VTLSEHHGSPDGYILSPIVFGASIAASTSSPYVHIGALIAPLYDPLRAAEDLAVLDLLLGGRLLVTVGAGYFESEFQMFGREIRHRADLVHRLPRALMKHLTQGRESGCDQTRSSQEPSVR
jgi:alkanesulfonate monooxygenase SsuD/methylene tetrahydromethanopterin reductase-like flavin-dependent oxidoreductase (luciferase family)